MLFCYPLGACFTFEAELAIAIHTIDYAWIFGWRQLWLESDNAFLLAIIRS